MESKIAGMMAINNFLMAPESVLDLAWRVDSLILRLDTVNGNRTTWEDCLDSVKGHPCVVSFESEIKWNRWNWREELIRTLDPVRTEFVLFLDEDETFSPDFEKEFDKFRDSDKNLMMFNYEMITRDGRQVKRYPAARHCKVFRWEEGISYSPYLGYAKPNVKNASIFLAESKIQHWCFYSKEMEESKVLHP